MALVQVDANNRGVKFLNTVIRETFRQNMFSTYASASPTSAIRRLTNGGKIGGDQINVPLVGQLNDNVYSTATVVGNEDPIDNYGCRFWIDWARKSVKASLPEIKRGSFDIMAQAAPLLGDFYKRLVRNETILALNSIPSESPPAGLLSANGQRINGILRTAATAAQNNAWSDAQADRVLYGSLKSNRVAGNYANSLNNVLATDRASAAILRVLKSMAEKSSPKIAPLTTDDGYERYVVFVGSNAFRDLEADPEIYASNKDARPREGTRWQDNPIFNDGDLLYDGLIIRKAPDIDRLTQVMNTAAPPLQVAPIFLLGQAAVAWVISKEMEATRLKEDDYQFLEGVGIMASYGIGKIFWKRPVGTPGAGQLVDYGLATAYVASPDDA